MKKRVLVTGDYVIDIHLLKGNKKDAYGENNLGTILASQYGGSLMTCEFMKPFIKSYNEEILKKDGDKKENKDVKPGNIELINGLKPVKLDLAGQSDHHSYLQWEYSVKENNKQSEEIDFAYRLTDKLGFGKGAGNGQKWLTKNDDPGMNDVIVIDEAAIGFRNDPEAWPDISANTDIILKTTRPIGEGLLWKHLCKTRKKSLTTIVRIEQIRHSDVKISKGISWEQTALDLAYEIVNERQISSLLCSDHVIITIGSVGAMIIRDGNKPEKAEFTLVFDPENMEDEWESKNAGRIINTVGIGSAFLAGFASHYSYSAILNNHDIAKSVMSGLYTMRNAMTGGIIRNHDNSKIGFREFPVPSLSPGQKERYAKAFVPSPYWRNDISYLKNHEWTILENNYDSIRPDLKTQPRKPYYSLARDLAYLGTDAILYAPMIRFENVVSFDRLEIESLRNIRKQVEFYADHDKGSRPLNIAVFGPPGAGKSFMVKALANSLFKNAKTQHVFFSFNLSQFKNPEELTGAFHAIRDAVLKGKLPFIFWDEFDSDDLFWLKHMISPMQDGEFQEGKDIHPLGKCIFVFAGGTSYTMEYFGQNMEEEQKKAKKVPDFLSRINCYLNVLGPNRRPEYDKKKRGWMADGDPGDLCFPIRRAMFIRSNLRMGEKERLKMDWGLLSAFLEITTFKNGARSLDRLLTQLALKKESRIERSDLPSDEIINMNVDYDEFMRLIYQPGRDKEQLHETLSKCIHDGWMGNDVKHSVYNCLFSELTYDGRLDNHAAAVRMEHIVRLTKQFELVPGIPGMHDGTGEEAFSKYIQNQKNLDKLAEVEHDEWENTRVRAGWKHGTVRSDYLKLHPCMVKFNELDKGISDRDKQKDKNKDRSAIQNYVRLLQNSGFVIIKS